DHFADVSRDVIITATLANGYFLSVEGKQLLAWIGNEVRIAHADKNGDVSFSFGPLNEGAYEIGVSFEGDEYNNGVENTSAKLTVAKAYDLTISDSYAADSGAGRHVQGSPVTINAGTRSNYTFAGWTTESDGVAFADEGSATTSFTMPENDVTVTAKWTYNGGGYIPGSITQDSDDDDGADDGEPINPFGDINTSDWFYDEVMYVYNKGLMLGVGDDKFDPYGTVSRAMVWMTLARLAGADIENSEPWYLAAREWAIENNISDGENPDAPITREQLAVMLFRFSGEAAGASQLEFDDIDDISDWAWDGLCWATAQEIVNGKDGDLLDPSGNANRAEWAAMLMRFLER
ncbi:MAG: S-layer homology domain-containing protein, partial [Clostridia bacterium]|nr:S-layer homology domain-containing protein [Clostridia bacterium]